MKMSYIEYIPPTGYNAYVHVYMTSIIHEQHNTEGNTTQKDKATQPNSTNQLFFKEKLAASSGTWTYDHLLFRQHSYQLSYWGSSAGWARITYTKQDKAPEPMQYIVHV